MCFKLFLLMGVSCLLCITYKISRFKLTFLTLCFFKVFQNLTECILLLLLLLLLLINLSILLESVRWNLWYPLGLLTWFFYNSMWFLGILNWEGVLLEFCFDIDVFFLWIFYWCFVGSFFKGFNKVYWLLLLYYYYCCCCCYSTVFQGQHFPMSPVSPSK